MVGVLPRAFIFEFERVFVFAFEFAPVFMFVFDIVAVGIGAGVRVAFAFALRAFALFALELVPVSPHPSSETASKRHIAVPTVFLILVFPLKEFFQPIDGPLSVSLMQEINRNSEKSARLA